MGSFDRGGKRSGGNFSHGFGGGNAGGIPRKFGRPSGGRDRDGGRDGGRPTMHKATCDECGDECEIPFRPSGGRPVYCSHCFEKQGGGGGDRPVRFDRGGGDRREKFDSSDRQMHDATCAKCGEHCQVPFRPTSSKPVFCSNCFEKEGGNSRGGSRGGDNSEVMEQLKTLNSKMERLLQVLAPNDFKEKSTKLENKKPEVKKEETKKAEPKKKEAIKVALKKEATKKEVKKVVAKKVSAKKKK